MEILNGNLPPSTSDSTSVRSSELSNNSSSASSLNLNLNSNSDDSAGPAPDSTPLERRNAVRKNAPPPPSSVPPSPSSTPTRTVVDPAEMTSSPLVRKPAVRVHSADKRTGSPDAAARRANGAVDDGGENLRRDDSDGNFQAGNRATQQVQLIVDELVETEKSYVNDLTDIVQVTFEQGVN